MKAARRGAEQRAVLLDLAEAVGVGAAFMDRAGAPVAWNASFGVLCGDEESRTRLAEHVRERFAAGGAAGGSAGTVPLRCERIAAARVLPGEDVALVQVRADATVPEPEPCLDALGLTPAQKRVAHGLAAGLANRAIARRLGVSEHTARRHTEQIFTKLGVRSRAAAALRLMGSG